MDMNIVRGNSHFVYDPYISGHNETFWKTLAGTPAVASNLLRLTSTGATKATQTLTSDATAPNDDDTVTIGSTVYTFKTTLSTGPAVPFEVLIGASAAEALDNLKSAINASAGAGTTYATGTTAHPDVTATTNTDTTQVIEAKEGGAASNAIATEETSDHLSWGDTTMDGGADDGAPCEIVSYSFYRDLEQEWIVTVPVAPTAGDYRAWGLKVPALGDRARAEFVIDDETGIKCKVYGDTPGAAALLDQTIAWDEDWTAEPTRFGIRNHGAQITFSIDGTIVAKAQNVGKNANVSIREVPSALHAVNGSTSSTQSDNLDITAIIVKEIGSLT